MRHRCTFGRSFYGLVLFYALFHMKKALLSVDKSAFFNKYALRTTNKRNGRHNMRAEAKHADQLAEVVGIVWPGHTREELRDIVLDYIGSEGSAVFAEEEDGRFIGVALCGLRHDYVEGCETSPVGYLEGVAVREENRHRGVAKKLVEECEQWAREKGCTEFASDCELINTASLDFHLAVGFTEENRLICFKKTL